MAADAPKPRAIKKAMMLGTMGPFKGSILDKMKALKAAGFEGVEPMSHEKQDVVLKALEETGLKAASVCCNTHWGKPLSDPDESRAQRGPRRAHAVAQGRQALRRHLRAPRARRLKKGVTYDDAFKRSVVEIKKAIPVAGELGVKIAIENVWNDFITKPEQAKDFLDAIDSPQVGWHFDIGNAIRYSAPEDVDSRAGQAHPEAAHQGIQQGEGLRRQAVRGDNNWPAIMKALDAAGYEGWGIAEQPGDQSKDADALEGPGRADGQGVRELRSAPSAPYQPEAQARRSAIPPGSNPAGLRRACVRIGMGAVSSCMVILDARFAHLPAPQFRL